MKIWAYLGLAVALIAAIGAAGRFAYNAGYSARNDEIRDDAIIAQNNAIQKGIDDWVATQDQAEVEIVVEERIVEKIRVVEREIPKIVEKIVTLTPECADLGTDYARLLNEQIAASNSSSGEGSESPPTLAEGVP